jgi:hypothetical protein
VPLRLLGGLHALVRRGRASWDEVPGALVREAEFLRRFLREERVQTNEVQRSWVLVPCFLLVARRAGFGQVDLVELGPSAGLNLILDRYRCVYRAGQSGPADARVRLGGEERRPLPAELLARPLQVRSRVGVDRDPVDVTDPAQAELLRAFVWADQSRRLELFDLAVDELRRGPPELVRGDLDEELPRLLVRLPEGALPIVFQTAVFGYVPAGVRARVRATLEEVGNSRPLAFVSSVPPREEGAAWWGLSVRLWPGGEAEYVADADFHGTWLEWLA